MAALVDCPADTGCAVEPTVYGRQPVIRHSARIAAEKREVMRVSVSVAETVRPRRATRHTSHDVAGRRSRGALDGSRMASYHRQTTYRLSMVKTERSEILPGTLEMLIL